MAVKSEICREGKLEAEIEAGGDVAILSARQNFCVTAEGRIPFSLGAPQSVLKVLS